MSFQGFSESYNDAFSVPADKGTSECNTSNLCGSNNYVNVPELSPRIVGEAFYNGETENEVRRIDRIDYRFLRDSM